MGNPNITINGRLSKDPESRSTQSGKAIAVITVPQQRSKKNDQGGYDNVGGTTWIEATFWEGDADAVMASLQKGSEVIVTGQLATQEYQSREGEPRTKLILEFPKVALVLKSGQAQRGSSGGGQQTEPDPWGTPQTGGSTYNDETPF